MNEEDYILLQTLLAKLRIVAMKEYGDVRVNTKAREKDLKIIRKVDWLRNNIIVNLSKVEVKENEVKEEG